MPEGETPDTTWTCVSSRAELVEKGTDPLVKDFLVYDWEYDYDATEEIIANQGHTCLVLIERLENASLSRVDKINDLYDHCVENDIPFFVTTASSGEEVELWRKRTGAEYPMYFTDEHALRRMIRANPGMMVLQDGVIVSKWDISDLPAVEEFAGNSTKLPSTEDTWVDNVRGWRFWILMLIVPLLLIAVVDYLLARREARRLARPVAVDENSAGGADAVEEEPMAEK